ncbi:MAG TPA: AIR synthase related protein [Planctomycetota bacterium]|nr:AIR synthase related protein [Planctomycetota bacterium]
MKVHSQSPFVALPWLAELMPAAAGELVVAGSERALGLATVTRRLGCRLALAHELGRGDALGIDMVHGAINALLARGALPQCAAVSVLSAPDSELAQAVTAGVASACRAHEVPIAVPAAGRSDDLQVGLVLSGAIIAAADAAPVPGDVVLALRGRGPIDADLAALQLRAHELGLGMQQPLADGEALGACLTMARPSHFSVLQQPLRERWPARVLDVDEHGLERTLRAALPAGVDVVWDFAGWQPPAPFAQWFAEPEAAMAAAAAGSFGCGMLVLVNEAEAPRWLKLCSAWNEPATAIGRLVAASAR